MYEVPVSEEHGVADGSKEERSDDDSRHTEPRWIGGFDASGNTDEAAGDNYIDI